MKEKKSRESPIPWEEAVPTFPPLDYPGPGIKVERRGGTVCVFLESPEAIAVARMLLPPTLVGRTECGTSEVWVYQVADDAT